MLAERWMHAEQWGRVVDVEARTAMAWWESLLLCWRRRGAFLELEERGLRRDWEQRWSTGHWALA